MKQLIVSLHDVHGGSFERVREQVSICEALEIRRFSILVVPEFHRKDRFEKNARLVAWLKERQYKGDDIVLHGLYHVDECPSVSFKHRLAKRFTSPTEAEFLDLGVEVARQRLRAGTERLREVGLNPCGFVAPAWLIRPEIARAIFSEGFVYTNTVDAILTADGRRIAARSLCYSTRTRLRRIGALAWNWALWRHVRGRALVRFSLHPNDLQYSLLGGQIRTILAESVRDGYSYTTYRDVVGEIPQQNVI